MEPIGRRCPRPTPASMRPGCKAPSTSPWPAKALGRAASIIPTGVTSAWSNGAKPAPGARSWAQSSRDAPALQYQPGRTAARDDRAHDLAPGAGFARLVEEMAPGDAGVVCALEKKSVTMK